MATGAENPDASAQTEALWRALKTKDSAAAVQALADGADVGAQDSGSTALHMAVVFWGDMPMIQRLLDAGADVDARDASGRTPLVAALRNAHYTTPHRPASPGAATLRAVVATLLRHGASAKVQDDRGRSLIAPALEEGDLALFDQLYAAGAPLPQDVVMMVLGAGVTSTDMNLVRRVFELSGPAQWSARGENGVTVAHRLASSAQMLPELQRFGQRDASLLAGRANDGRTPLHEAALYGNVEGLRWLVENGGDLNAVTKDNQSVLHWAAVGGHVSVLAWMIDQKPALTIRDRKGLRAVDYYVESSAFAMTEEAYKLGRVRALGGGEAEVARGLTRDSPLHAAIQRRDLKTVKLLLEEGADSNVIDGSGYSALSHALSLSIRSLNVPDDVRFGQKLLNLLMEYGADPTRRVPAHGRTLLEDADSLGRLEEIERLRRRYARRD